VSSYTQLTDLAREAVDAWAPGMTERIRSTPYLTLFPASLEDPRVPGPPSVHRFRDAAAAARPLEDRGPGDDRPLVYVSFGSQAAGVPTAAPVYRVALDAVADLDARVLLTTGDGLDGQLEPPGPHVRVARWVPQEDVLAHARVVVSHGGSGTTLGALSAGVPLVITPLFADQPQNGERVAAVGAGVVVRPRDPSAPSSAIDPADLREAIATVLGGDGYARAAQRIAAEISALPPADEILSVLDGVRTPRGG
jgi:MGT family glycosyltransferase